MERQQLLKVMVPVGAFALLVILVAAVITMNSGGGTPSTAQPSDGSPPPPDMHLTQPPPPGAKFDFPLDGPEWKDVSSGLKMWDVKEGTGEVCPSMAEKPNVWPVMHYTGWLTTGSVFDSSKKTGRPLDQYKLSELIKGWQLGVPGMKVGGVRRLLIPSDLGYGSRGGQGIPGGATLVFEMELVGFK